MSNRPILVFDVNETLLDLESVTPHFARIFGDGAVMRQWFAQVVLYSEALTLVGKYTDFGELGGAALSMLAEIKGRTVGEDDLAAVKEAVASMPPHPDVPEALRTLQSEGFRMVTLTNNPLATCAKQLDRAALTPFFERLFSVDEAVRRYKPAPESYRAVAEALAASPSNLCLVACHSWDIIGAGAAGLQTALITRPGNAPIKVGPQPGIVGADLAAVAAALIKRYPR